MKLSLVQAVGPRSHTIKFFKSLLWCFTITMISDPSSSIHTCSQHDSFKLEIHFYPRHWLVSCKHEASIYIKLPCINKTPEIT